MSWLLIITLGMIIFFNRYIFLEPNLPLKIPHIIREALKYSAPCLLTAICGPIILLDNQHLRSFPDNPYLWGTIISILLALLIRNILLCVLMCLIAFYCLLYFIPG